MRTVIRIETETLTALPYAWGQVAQLNIPHSYSATDHAPQSNGIADALGDGGTQPRENVAQGSPDFIVRGA